MKAALLHCSAGSRRLWHACSCGMPERANRPCCPGTALRISGARLGAGAPQEALEAAKTAVLQLHANGVHRCMIAACRGAGLFLPAQEPNASGCRPMRTGRGQQMRPLCRARPDDKLGRQKLQSGITPLHAVHSLGGMVPLTIVTVQRIMKPVAPGTAGKDRPPVSLEELQVCSQAQLLSTRHSAARCEHTDTGHTCTCRATSKER